MDKSLSNCVYCVYIHTNKINNKIYVGQTGMSVKERWRKNGSGYMNTRKDGSYCQPLFARAIQKYGWGNFEHIIFATSLTKLEADCMEQMLIALYQSNNPKYGYNLSSGGESGATGIRMSDETKKKISAIRKKCWENEEYRKNQIESHKWQTGANHPFYGRKHSDATKEKIKQSHIGLQVSENTKQKLSMANSGSGNPFYGKSHSDKSKQKISTANSGANNGRAKRVIQYDTQGNFIRIWEYARQASRELNINYSSIIACCVDRQKSAGGFAWKYAMEE